MNARTVAAGPIDPRIERTRAALLGAFNRLILTRGYEAITPALIASTAGVARSTFYEHYAGKAALLRHALRRVMQPLADAIDRERTAAAIEFIVAHFWENRRLARAMMSERPRRIMEDLLAELVAANLRRARYSAALPLPMAARHVAHGQLAMIDAWLADRRGCDAATLAQALRATSIAAADALRADRLGGHRDHGLASSGARP